MPGRTGYWSQESQKRRVLLAGVVFISIGLFILFTGDSGGDTKGIPNTITPWVIIACGLGLIILSRGKRLR